MAEPVTGKTLIERGYKPGSWFKEAIAAANDWLDKGGDREGLSGVIDLYVPPPTIPLRAYDETEAHLNIDVENEDEADNVRKVIEHMRELARVPTIKASAIMPDACPCGSAPGTIPVGGIVAAENAIHPGMHSADICCSMAVTIFGDVDVRGILDAGMELSHFGGGGRPRGQQIIPPNEVMARLDANEMLKQHHSLAIEHFATQGDGNHFFYVGRLASTGEVALVTHHGSRAPGAALYKAGMAIADRFRRQLSPETPKHNAWIPANTSEGEVYWDALQAIRLWTKANHYAIHDRIAEHLGLEITDRFWNEHNFVFRKSDGLFYHAKGATPAWRGYADDDIGLTLIPLNMAEPILIVKGSDAANGLGFAPHGAGRNFSRTQYLRRHEGRTEAEIVAEQTRGIDARFFCGIPDVSELPGAYKSPAAVRRQITQYGLAEVVDEILPVGCIMAGDWLRPFHEKRKAAKAARSAE